MDYISGSDPLNFSEFKSPEGDLGLQISGGKMSGSEIDKTPAT